MDQDEDVQLAVQGAKEHLAAQYRPFGIEPEVYVVEACGLVAVCLPWTAQQRMVALRKGDLGTTEGRLRLCDQVVMDTLYWVRGQQREGRPGALQHARGLVDIVGGRFINLMLEIGSKVMDLQSGTEAQTTGKKL